MHFGKAFDSMISTSIKIFFLLSLSGALEAAVFIIPPRRSVPDGTIFKRSFRLESPVALRIVNEMGDVSVRGNSEDDRIRIEVGTFPNSYVRSARFEVNRDIGELELVLRARHPGRETKSLQPFLDVRLPSRFVAHLEVESAGEMDVGSILDGPASERQIILTGRWPLMARHLRAKFMHLRCRGQVHISNSQGSFLLESSGCIQAVDNEGPLDAVFTGEKPQEGHTRNVLQVTGHKGTVRAEANTGLVYLANPDAMAQQAVLTGNAVLQGTPLSDCSATLARVQKPAWGQTD